ncbi:MAG: pantoate--beta-alanine ligase [Gammaproteobacteria bacterium]|nr:pantoate--beta-alanine ligase [Gammaproteobacteria bacterium]MBU1655611.1 pantoate--beta-alanine ligase [Gammaproteobacteria bacterium]MBU1962283.1 pantoate--beta-alanine ligase [Gammaproteobacteria bacterium]
MICIERLEDLRRQVADWRRTGERILFVPTMGNLHEGHLKLVREAKGYRGRRVVSIFVNPMQFGAGEDLASYPRTLTADRALLEGLGNDLLFIPAEETIYPGGQAGHTEVRVPDLSEDLCGTYRPGHFTGVATVVCKLFNMVRPDVAFFGEKDFQQLMVIRRMVADLAMPVEIIGVATEREPSGLAMSSRNQYMNEAERRLAPRLYQELQALAEALGRGDDDYPALELMAKLRLDEAGFRPDYVSIRRAEDLCLPVRGEPHLVVLAAARLGKTRLIDNLRVERGGPGIATPAATF